MKSIVSQENYTAVYVQSTGLIHVLASADKSLCLISLYEFVLITNMSLWLQA